MNSWVEAKLGDLFSFKNGMNAEKTAYGNGIPFVNVMDVFGTDVLTSDIVRGKIQANEKQIKEYLVKRGDVLLNRTSETFDEIALATVYMDDAPIVFGGFVIRARPRTPRLDPKFCVYFFQSDAIRREMIRRGQGAVRANIGQKDLATVPAVVPPLAEQKRIAEILSTWDRAIEATEKLIANSEAQKKALMQQLLTGKKRLPGFSRDWKEYRLGEIGSTFTGLSGKSAKDFGDGEFYIQYKNVFENEEVNFSALDRVRISTSENQYIVEHGDFIFTTSSETPEEVGVSSVVLEPSGSIYLNSFCFGYRPNNRSTILPHFGKFFFRSNLFRRRLHSLAQGSTRYNLSKSAFLDICVHLPEPDEQAAVANILRTTADAVARRKADLRRLKLEKAALMQQLLTGKRRVKIKGEAQAA